MAEITSSSPCWERAFHCPSDQQVIGNQSTCEAWYRCDGLSNYVIRWRCQGKTLSTGSFNPTLRKCNNSSKSVDAELCPPPVVCPTSMAEDKGVTVTNDDVIDVDIVLAVVLAIFALITLVLIVIASCRYWLARRRFHRRFHPKYRHFRAFTAPRYPGWWAFSGSPKNLKKFMGKSGSVNGIPYTDIYVPYQNQHSTNSYHHHTQVGDDSRNNAHWSFYRTKKQHKLKRAGKVFGDRSVLTGSFVYQPSVVQYETRGSNVDQSHNYSTSRRDVYYPKRGTRPWSHDIKSPGAKTNRNISTASLFHHAYEREYYFKGNNRAKPTRPTQYVVQPPSTDESRDNFKPYPAPQISSIHIPTYDDNGGNNNFRGDSRHLPYVNADNKHGVFQSHFNRGHLRGEISPENDWSDSWRSSSSISPYNNGRVHYKGVSESASVASKNWQYTVFSQQQQHIVHSGSQDEVKTTKHDLEPSTNSPDVISSHNLSPHVTHIAQDTHIREDNQLGRDLIARITVPSSQNHYIDDDDGTKNGDCVDNKSCVDGQSNITDSCSSSSSATPLNQELSYDSFRNEHLRQLARQGAAASSSTLDKGVGQVRASNFKVKPYHQ